MAENQFLSVLRVWASVAWADGVIVDEEASAFKLMVEQAILDDDEQKTALRWLESKVGLDTENIQSVSVNTREGIYEAAVRMAMADEKAVAEEIALLARLRKGLEISDDRAKELEAGVPMAGPD